MIAGLARSSRSDRPAISKVAALAETLKDGTLSTPKVAPLSTSSGSTPFARTTQTGRGSLPVVRHMAPPAAAPTPRTHQSQFQHSEKWVTELVQTPGMSPVLTAGALLSKSSSLPSDHMFTAFLKLGLIRNMLCLYSSEPCLLHSIVTLGSNVCGHQGIVHGGLTAALVDETLGALVYILKREGIIGDGPSFTVRLEMDYKKPVPASTIVCCTAELQSAEGRKAWVKARVQDQPGGVLYAEGKALFVIPKAHQPSR